MAFIDPAVDPRPCGIFPSGLSLSPYNNGMPLVWPTGTPNTSANPLDNPSSRDVKTALDAAEGYVLRIRKVYDPTQAVDDTTAANSYTSARGVANYRWRAEALPTPPAVTVGSDGNPLFFITYWGTDESGGSQSALATYTATTAFRDERIGFSTLAATSLIGSLGPGGIIIQSNVPAVLTQTSAGVSSLYSIGGGATFSGFTNVTHPGLFHFPPANPPAPEVGTNHGVTIWHGLGKFRMCWPDKTTFTPDVTGWKLSLRRYGDNNYGPVSTDAIAPGTGTGNALNYDLIYVTDTKYQVETQGITATPSTTAIFIDFNIDVTLGVPASEDGSSGNPWSWYGFIFTHSSFDGTTDNGFASDGTSTMGMGTGTLHHGSKGIEGMVWTRLMGINPPPLPPT